MKIQAFEYDGKRITFDFGDGEKMVNATEMTKAFADKNKRLDNFMRLKQTKEFIVLLEEDLNKSVHSDVRERKKAIKVVRGGVPELQGTWVEKRLALKLAAWLEPRFELWGFGKIEELLTQGHTSLFEKLGIHENEIKGLEWVFQKIRDNAHEIYNISDYLNEIRRLEGDKKRGVD